MTSTYAAESNRRNALKSSGPKSLEGKERSRSNSLKHGATARVLALPGEDPEELAKQRHAWIDSNTTDDPIERAILERAFEAWQQLGRSLRVQQGRVERQMQEAEVLERQRADDVALELGNRLFCDSNGPSQCYPNRPPFAGTTLTSGNDSPGDPDQPARLVLRLESTAAGCRWLLARWKELGEILEDGECWRSPDRFRAIRLLGKQPLDALVDRHVRGIFLACHVLRPVKKSPFDDLLREVGDNPLDSRSDFRPALKELTIAPYTPKDPAEARNILANVVDRATSRLQVLLAEHEAREEALASSAADRHAFDFDHDGELMRRYEASCDRAFHRALAQLRLLRKDAQAPVRGMRTAARETVRPQALTLFTESANETEEHALADPELANVPRTMSEMSECAIVPDPRAVVSDDPRPAAEGDPKLRNEPDAASIHCDDSACTTRGTTELGTPNSQKLRNEPDAASIDRDVSADTTRGPANSGAPSGMKRRNEPDAASIDRDVSADTTRGPAKSGALNGMKRGNEPDAASIDRDDSACGSVPRSPAGGPPKPPNAPRRRSSRSAMRFVNKEPAVGRVGSRCREPAGCEGRC